VRQALRCLLLVLAITALASRVDAASVRVKHREGTSHGFLVVHSADGQLLASGEMTETVDGERVNSETTLYFKDGSIHDEVTVFSQNRRFRLLSDHVRQSGPSFPDGADARIDATSGTVTTQSLKDGASKPDVRHMKLPDDLANGLLVTVLRNFPPGDETTVPMLVGSSKPRLIKVTIRQEGRDEFAAGDRTITPVHYVAHITIGGVAGAMASVLGKQPPDMHFWILGGKAPTFIRAITPLYEGGPIWTVDLAPVTPRESKSHERDHSQ
jgi:hypothetical protein